LPFIKTIEESEAKGKIKEVYQKRMNNHSGKVSNIAKIINQNYMELQLAPRKGNELL